MPRLREILAHGGIATLAVVFALAAASFALANAVAQETVRVIGQLVLEPDSGAFQFTVFATSVDYSYILQSSIALAIVAAALFGVWRLTRSLFQKCPECESQIPHEASVCRFCTAELGKPEL